MQNEDRILTGFALEAGASEVRAAYQSEIKRLQKAQHEYAVATAKLEIMHHDGELILNDMRRESARLERRLERWRRRSERRRIEFEHMTYWTMVGLVCLALVLGWTLHAVYVHTQRTQDSTPAQRTQVPTPAAAQSAAEPASAAKKATTAVAPPTN